MSERRDFWLSCGHHLLDRRADGALLVTDEFLKTYLARPEIMPPAEACVAERAIHRTLLGDPRQPIAAAQIAAIVDADARENWELMISWRDHLVSHPSLEAAYLQIVRDELKFPYLFLDQIVQVILRNMLDDCDDAFVLRAAELFFRPQKLTLYDGSLLAADEETAAAFTAEPLSPLVALLGLPAAPGIDVLSEGNADMYWERSDAFDMALDLTGGRRGLAALGTVVTLWVRHLLAVDVEIAALTELCDTPLTWYVGLDANATRIGDALWNGAELDTAQREQVVGLFRMTFANTDPTYLIAAMSADKALRLKPQNLITGLPILPRAGATN